MSLFTLTVILFLTMDPLGNISSFLNLSRDLPERRRSYIVIREMSIALIAMLLFNFLGEYIFDILGISHQALVLTSGAILFMVAIKILFPSSDSIRANLPPGEPFITPLAIPLIAGPSLLATIMLFAKLETDPAKMLIAIFIAWSASVTILLLSSRLKRLIGSNGLLACERLMGMILVMIAIQRILEGVLQVAELCGKA